MCLGVSRWACRGPGWRFQTWIWCLITHLHSDHVLELGALCFIPPGTDRAKDNRAAAWAVGTKAVGERFVDR